MSLPLAFRAALAGAAVLATALAAAPAAAATYHVDPMDLGSGYTLSGRISTDGAAGPVTAAHITGWDLKVTSVTDTVYTPGNTSNLSSGAFVQGGQILVPTSPDGVGDGGSLRFYGGHFFQVAPADFSGLNTDGGQALYIAGSAFDAVNLGAPNGVDYVAAQETAPGSSTFDLTPVSFSGGVVMSGTLTTDGSSGAANLVDWMIRVRETQTWRFSPANSQVLSDWGLFAQGHDLKVQSFDVDGNPGSFLIGAFPHFEFNELLLGDFSNDAGGVAGYISPFDFQVVTPLPLDSGGAFLVAHSVPEPATWSLMILGFLAAGAALRNRQVVRA